jgi:probable rRNA maturation factor
VTGDDAGAEPIVDLVIEEPRWETISLSVLADRAARAVLLELERPPERHALALLAADDARLAGLNRDFRGRETPTNILSWPAFAGDIPAGGDEPVFLGDLALAYETCAAEAKAAGIPLADHAAHLVVHGVLHLLGLDHAEDADAEAMEALEAKILATMGVANPYGP